MTSSSGIDEEEDTAHCRGSAHLQLPRPPLANHQRVCVQHAARRSEITRAQDAAGDPRHRRHADPVTRLDSGAIVELDPAALGVNLKNAIGAFAIV
jgi:hypothetical protein